MTKSEFEQKLTDIADCWHRHDYQAAAAHYAADICYGDPVRYAIKGRDELLEFFSNDDGLPQITTWHTILFDETKQTGAAEYSYTGTYSYHGIVLIKIDDNRITHWREYQHIDPRDWSDFTATTPLP
jgi:SnoaL-like protein